MSKERMKMMLEKEDMFPCYQYSLFDETKVDDFFGVTSSKIPFEEFVNVRHPKKIFVCLDKEKMIVRNTQIDFSRVVKIVKAGFRLSSKSYRMVGLMYHTREYFLVSCKKKKAMFYQLFDDLVKKKSDEVKEKKKSRSMVKKKNKRRLGEHEFPCFKYNLLDKSKVDSVFSDDNIGLDKYVDMKSPEKCIVYLDEEKKMVVGREEIDVSKICTKIKVNHVESEVRRYVVFGLMYSTSKEYLLLRCVKKKALFNHRFDELSKKASQDIKEEEDVIEEEGVEEELQKLQIPEHTYPCLAFQLKKKEDSIEKVFDEAKELGELEDTESPPEKMMVYLNSDRMELTYSSFSVFTEEIDFSIVSKVSKMDFRGSSGRVYQMYGILYDTGEYFLLTCKKKKRKFHKSFSNLVKKHKKTIKTKKT